MIISMCLQGICSLQDEQFASEKQQEAYDLLAGLLLWLHRDLANQVRSWQGRLSWILILFLILFSPTLVVKMVTKR